MLQEFSSHSLGFLLFAVMSKRKYDELRVRSILVDHVRVSLEVYGENVFVFFESGKTAAAVSEECGRQVGYGGGGFLSYYGECVALSQVLFCGETYRYHMSLEQTEQRATAETRRKIAESQLRAAQMDEEASALRNKRAKRLGDLNKEWSALHEAGRAVRFASQSETSHQVSHSGVRFVAACLN